MGQRAELGEQLRLQQADAMAILGPGGRDVERHHAARIEAAVHDGEVVVAAEQQRRGADERHAQRDLGHDQPLLEAVAASGHAARPAAIAWCRSRRVPTIAGKDADDDRGDERRARP